MTWIAKLAMLLVAMPVIAQYRLATNFINNGGVVNTRSPDGQLDGSVVRNDFGIFNSVLGDTGSLNVIDGRIINSDGVQLRLVGDEKEGSGSNLIGTIVPGAGVEGFSGNIQGVQLGDEALKGKVSVRGVPRLQELVGGGSVHRVPVGASGGLQGFPVSFGGVPVSVGEISGEPVFVEISGGVQEQVPIGSVPRGAERVPVFGGVQGVPVSIRPVSGGVQEHVLIGSIPRGAEPVPLSGGVHGVPVSIPVSGGVQVQVPIGSVPRGAEPVPVPGGVQGIPVSVPPVSGGVQGVPVSVRPVSGGVQDVPVSFRPVSGGMQGLPVSVSGPVGGSFGSAQNANAGEVRILNGPGSGVVFSGRVTDRNRGPGRVVTVAAFTPTVTRTVTVDHFRTRPFTVFNTVPVTTTVFQVTTVTRATENVVRTPVNNLVGVLTSVVTRPIFRTVTETTTNYRIVELSSVFFDTITHTSKDISHSTTTFTLTERVTVTSTFVHTIIRTHAVTETRTNTVTNTHFTATGYH